MDEETLKMMLSRADLEAPAPSAGLAGRILLRIEKEERRRLMIKSVAFGAVLMGSVALMIYGGTEAFIQASRSGLFAFTSLFLSDFATTMGNFSDFSLSIVESFPVFSVAILFSGVFFAVWSAARFLGEVALMRTHTFSSPRS